MARTVFTDFIGWPADSEQVAKPDDRVFNNLVIGALRGLPADLTPYPGEIMLARADGLGFAPASQSGATSASFGGLSVRLFEPFQVDIVGNLPLTDHDHDGALLYCGSASAVDLTIGRNADPTLGVGDGFICTIARAATAGAVRVLFASPLSNGNGAGDIHVSAGGFAQLWVPRGGNSVFFVGATEA